jgi:hypothetical protein
VAAQLRQSIATGDDSMGIGSRAPGKVENEEAAESGATVVRLGFRVPIGRTDGDMVPSSTGGSHHENLVAHG